MEENSSSSSRSKPRDNDSEGLLVPPPWVREQEVCCQARDWLFLLTPPCFPEPGPKLIKTK